MTNISLTAVCKWIVFFQTFWQYHYGMAAPTKEKTCLLVDDNLHSDLIAKGGESWEDFLKSGNTINELLNLYAINIHKSEEHSYKECKAKKFHFLHWEVHLGELENSLTELGIQIPENVLQPFYNGEIPERWTTTDKARWIGELLLSIHSSFWDGVKLDKFINEVEESARTLREKQISDLQDVHVVRARTVLTIVLGLAKSLNDRILELMEGLVEESVKDRFDKKMDGLLEQLKDASNKARIPQIARELRRAEREIKTLLDDKIKRNIKPKVAKERKEFMERFVGLFQSDQWKWYCGAGAIPVYA